MATSFTINKKMEKKGNLRLKINPGSIESYIHLSHWVINRTEDVHHWSKIISNESYFHLSHWVINRMEDFYFVYTGNETNSKYKYFRIFIGVIHALFSVNYFFLYIYIYIYTNKNNVTVIHYNLIYIIRTALQRINTENI